MQPGESILYLPSYLKAHIDDEACCAYANACFVEINMPLGISIDKSNINSFKAMSKTLDELKHDFCIMYLKKQHAQSEVDMLSEAIARTVEGASSASATTIESPLPDDDWFDDWNSTSSLSSDSAHLYLAQLYYEQGDLVGRSAGGPGAVAGVLARSPSHAQERGAFWCWSSVFFVHTPFLSSEVFRCLTCCKEILDRMLGTNLICFQTYSYTCHFTSTCIHVCGYETTSRGAMAALLVHREVRALLCVVLVVQARAVVPTCGASLTCGIKAGVEKYVGINMLGHVAAVTHCLVGVDVERVARDT
ncbi:glycosyltransferase family 20-domain-containing protein [Suillus subaureus]|uniref:Glycosyltransferase family 20-domain-containing protein n=1 Tax=Suillus subaureus TaxID=48587 RepID=A0A9P7J5A6_9AGAM|nr:glycosyltransferase family 20-domain-containing protein [Suillus subaureus]KAG1803422.1 glycosyltransferase family 20-domain-containing protein [Suillus subaureus]